MPESTFFTTTEITIQDYNDNKPVVFSSLQLQESMLSVNNFSFSLQPAISDDILTSIINFKKEVMGKEVLICFKDMDGKENHKFKGIVSEVNSAMIDERYYEFQVSGKGLFSKVDELKVCRSFYKKKLDAIIDSAFQNSDLKSSITKDVQTTKELHYTVQYHQTLFGFLSFLAIRFGEWMYYDGEQLQFGKKPDGDAIELTVPGDVSNLNIRAQVVRSPKGMVTTDIFKSEVIAATTKEAAPDNPMLKTSEDAGSKAIEEAPANMFVSSGFNQDAVNDKFKLEQQAVMASSVFLTGITRNSKLRIGTIIKIKENADAGGKSYIITHIIHTAGNTTNYSNNFTVVPVEVAVPPYTNPLLIAKATSQAAIVTDNEDDAGLARIKVKFPWMADDEKTPWISALVPHAGKDKGFRFLPEKDDEVMVGFWDGNIETPFVNGAVYTEKNTPGIAEGGNNIKMIGTHTGRRFEIDDDKGLIRIYDNMGTEPPINAIMLRRRDEKLDIVIQSKESDSNYASIRLAGKDGFSIFYNDGEKVGRIEFTYSDQKLEVYSKGDISIKADGSVNIKAGQDINLNAGGNVKCDAGQNLELKAGTDLSGKAINVSMKGDATFKAESMQTDLKGVQTSVNGDAMATIKGGLVMIN